MSSSIVEGVMSVPEVTLRLTEPEAAALAALTEGIAGVVGTGISSEDAVIAVIELGLRTLIDDFEVPDPAARERVHATHEALRRGWTRGNAGL
jgi:hypothetical protein